MIDSLVSSDSHLALITRAILDAVHPLRIVLFGSRARGNMRDDSDYDLLIVLVSGEQEETERSIRAALPSAVGPRVDLVVRTASRYDERRSDVGTLDYIIDREGRVLYDADGGGGRGLASRSHEVPRIRERRAGLPPSVDEWMVRANQDLRALDAIVSVDPTNADAICLHAHQSIEKLLKAAVVAVRVPPPRTHNLAELLALGPPELRDDPRMLAACDVLTKLYRRSRYPETVAPSFEEGQSATAHAREVRELLTAAIESRRR